MSSNCRLRTLWLDDDAEADVLSLHFVEQPFSNHRMPVISLQSPVIRQDPGHYILDTDYWTLNTGYRRESCTMNTEHLVCTRVDELTQEVICQHFPATRVTATYPLRHLRKRFTSMPPPSPRRCWMPACSPVITPMAIPLTRCTGFLTRERCHGRCLTMLTFFPRVSHFNTLRVYVRLAGCLPTRLIEERDRQFHAPCPLSGVPTDRRCRALGSRPIIPITKSFFK